MVWLAATGAAGVEHGTATSSDPPLLITNIGGRSTVSLDGTWRTIIDPYGAGYLSYRAERRGDGFFRDAKTRRSGRVRLRRVGDAPGAG